MNRRQNLTTRERLQNYRHNSINVDIRIIKDIHDVEELLNEMTLFMAQAHSGKPEVNENCIECDWLARAKKLGYGFKEEA